jgi:hypothetical protein
MNAVNIAKIALREFDISVGKAELIGQHVLDTYCLEDISYNDLVQLIDEAMAINFKKEV